MCAKIVDRLRYDVCFKRIVDETDIEYTYILLALERLCLCGSYLLISQLGVRPELFGVVCFQLKRSSYVQCSTLHGKKGGG